MSQKKPIKQAQRLALKALSPRGKKEDQESGQSLAEAALFLLLVVVAVIVFLTPLGEQIGAVYQQVTAALGG